MKNKRHRKLIFLPLATILFLASVAICVRGQSDHFGHITLLWASYTLGFVFLILAFATDGRDISSQKIGKVVALYSALVAVSIGFSVLLSGELLLALLGPIVAGDIMNLKKSFQGLKAGAK